MKRKLITLLLCLATFFATIGLSACFGLMKGGLPSDDVPPPEDIGTPPDDGDEDPPLPDELLLFTLSQDGNSYVVTGCHPLAKEVAIPSTYNDLPVTAIGDEAFTQCENLTSISIPDSVTSVSRNAFFFTFERDGFFYVDKWITGCVSTSESITVPSGFVGIANSAFEEKNDVKEITFPEGIRYLGNYALADCDNLEKVNLPDTLTHIGTGAFFECPLLTEIALPANIVSIGECAFFCQYLIRITLPESNAYYTTENGGLYTKDGKTLLVYTMSKNTESFTLPDSVTDIASWAFGNENSSWLQNLRLGSGVQNIHTDAFANMTSLKRIAVDSDNATFASQDGVLYNKAKTKILYVPWHIEGNVTIPEGVTAIRSSSEPELFYGDDSTFFRRYYLEGVSIPASVTHIELAAFADTYRLEILQVEENNAHYKSVDDVLFTKDGGTILEYAASKPQTSFTVPATVTEIATQAFYHARYLTQVEIPATVTAIGAFAFGRCERMTSYTVAENNPNYTSLDGNLYNKDKSTLLQYAVGKTEGKFVLPTNVKTIAGGAFERCSSLQVVILNEGLTSIWIDAFNFCNYLKTIVFPTSLAEVGYNAFSGCYRLNYLCYRGTSSQWKAISYAGEVKDFTVYYYSETNPTTEGNYWHYVEDSVTIW